MRLVPRRTSLCLTMIVKDEAHVIERCLESCRGLIDFVRIIDTGSTDNTKELIHGWCQRAKIDYKILSHPWVDFAHNRNEALQFAGKCPATHLLLIDADEILHATKEQSSQLKVALATNDDVLFTIPMVYGNNICTRTNLVRNLPGRLCYHYPMHEELWLDGNGDAPLTMIRTSANYGEGIHVTTPQDGARTQAGDRLERDLLVLGEAYKIDLNPRHLFYMGQILRIGAHGTNAPEAWALVKDTYLEYLRAMNGEYKPHCYVAALWVARILEMEGAHPHNVLNMYQRVHDLDPGRPEAMGGMAAYCADHGMPAQAEEYAKKVGSCRGSNSFAFLETEWYGKADEILKGLEVPA